MSAPREQSGRAPKVLCELSVTEVAPSLEIFAEALGLAVRLEEPGFAVLALGHAELLINATPPAEAEAGNPLRTAPDDAPRGLGLELVVVVDDLPAAFTRISALDSVQVASLPEARPWGARDFRFLHPDGYYVRVSDA